MLYKVMPNPALFELHAARSESDNKQYRQKAERLHRLMFLRPEEFEVSEAPAQGGHPGIRHTPTNFQLHVPRKYIPASIWRRWQDQPAEAVVVGEVGVQDSEASKKTEQADKLDNQTKQAAPQPTTPWQSLPWREQYIKYLWEQENAGRKGLQPDGTWYTHLDANGKQQVIGPGVFVPEGTQWTQQQLDEGIEQAFNQHVERARRYYPQYDQLQPEAQQVLLDTTWQAVEAPDMYKAILAQDYERAVAENNLKSKGQLLTRRNNARTTTFLNPLRDQWAAQPAPQTQQPSVQAVAAPTPTPTTPPAQNVAQPHPQPAQGDADTMGNQISPPIELQTAPPDYLPTQENPPTSWTPRPEGGYDYMIPKQGSTTEEPPQTGPEALRHALSQLDLDEVEREQREILKGGAKSKRSRAVQLLNAVEGMRGNDVRPEELMISRMPILPAQFRPFSAQGTTFIAGDANVLYKDLFNLREAYQQERELWGDEGAGEARRDLYKAVKASYGYGEPTNEKARAKGVSGFMKQVLGNSPKYSVMQRRLVSKTVDSSARSTIVIDPELGMDEIGIPSDMAWTLYGPWVQRRLVQAGVNPGKALELVRDRDPQAARALAGEMEDRWILASRAPTWHRFGIMSAKPKLVEGKAIAVNPYTGTGYNLDFNGDDQIGKVLLLSPKQNNHFLNLHAHVDDDTASSMIAKNIIPAFSTSNHNLHLVDLEDFPHTDLQHHKPDGRNGSIDFYSVPEDLRVVALDERTGRAVWAPVMSYSVHPQRLVEIVSLSNGRQITTDDDPRAIYGVDPAQPSLTFVRATPTEAKERQIAVPVVKDVEESLQTLGTIDSIAITDDRRLPLNWGTGYLLGALVGDGWWDKRKYSGRTSIYLSDLKGYNAQKVHEVLESLFSGHVRWYRYDFNKTEGDDRYGSTVRHTFCHPDFEAFTQFLTQWMGGEGDDTTSGSGNKKLPDFFMIAPKVFREGMLCGLMDTDGTVCVTHGKAKPQLSMQITSTSLRLMNDIKFLCLGLGIRASVSYSKTTLRNNTSWICNLSTVHAKKQGCLKDLQRPDKVDAFLSTPVEGGTNALAIDRIVVPQDVHARIGQDMRHPKVGSPCISGDDERWREAQRRQDVTRRQTERACWTCPRELAEGWLAHAQAIRKRRQELTELVDVDLASDNPVVTPERAALWKNYVTNMSKAGKQVEHVRKLKNRIDTLLRVGNMGPRALKGLQEALAAVEPTVLFDEDQLVRRWVEQVVEQRTISWAFIKEVEETGVREDGYDLTVPGFETFMSLDGVILSNTMNIHLPATPESQEEAKTTLRPSNFLFKTRDPEQVMHGPKHEFVLGLAEAARRQGLTQTFPDMASFVQAQRQGRVSLSDDVELEDQDYPTFGPSPAGEAPQPSPFPKPPTQTTR